MIPTITQAWDFDAAQTNVALVTCSSTQRAVVTYGQATVANSTAVDVALTLGFGTSTIATITNDSATGATGVFMTHPGLAHGGGMVVANGGAPIATGAADEDIRITVTVATGGFVRVVLTYWIDDLS